MKSNKIKTLVAAVALAASGTAFAAFDGSAGNSSVLFNAYESVSGYSFALDTGLRKDDITSSFSGLSVNLANDANWNSFLSHVGSAHLADIRWNVIAADTNAGSVDGDPVSYLTTGSADGVPAGTRNAQLNSWGGNFNSYVTASGNWGATGFENGNSTLHLKEGPADYASFEVAEGNNWNTKSNFDTTAGLGGSLSFYEITKNGVPVTNVVNAELLGKVTLSESGALAISSVSPIPEADSWAMLLAGLALVATIARRRSVSPA
ncbi:MAG TPA: PEP-CTERM sorting domain-containing protein [Nitrosospira sp.]|jgi:MYXO-CTERM domain-containing protein|nr:PEP-CTERM sorting domain-containing protein [Nitrosospira sp.]